MQVWCIIELQACIDEGSWKGDKLKQYLPISGTGIVIPGKLRTRVLVLAHEGHRGIVSMKQRLRSKVWWPGIDRQAENFCKTCHGCQLVSHQSNPKPIKRISLPRGPWQDLAVDLLGPLPSRDSVLVVVDYFSRFMKLG